MPGKKITLALIGAGGIGSVWVEAIKTIRSVSLVAVVDADLARVQKIAKQFPACRVYRNVESIVHDKTITMAIVATPHFLLAPISFQLLAAGKHVLSEKPGAISLAELKKNSTLAKRKKIHYAIGFNHRYHAAMQQAKKLVDAGAIGKLQFIRARYGFGGRKGYEKEWRFKKAISGGGELLDQGVHMIDLARWFMGDFVDVKGFAEDLFWHGEVEDNGFLLLRTKQRQVASIHVSWSNWNWIHSFEIFGTKGYCQIDGLDQRYRGPERLTVGRCDEKLSKPPTEKVYVFKNELKHTSFARELVDFIHAIQKKSKPPINGSDGYKAMKIVQSIYNQKK